ncbi:candidate histidine kinase, hybrid [Ramlibacter tataouinensis TTB310]|uniref:histidine kinase n=2 Tax=Ramlibacter tataouinensis TaxID=94132 RepID=F5Y0B7_RAMTT|nr:candidate histidine kinase, hybrid [Ramlibacter tataouinensis TTB310]
MFKLFAQLIGMHLDTQDRIRATEAALAEARRSRHELDQVTAASEQRKRLYETILSNTPDLAYVFDLEHRFIYANEVLLRMWGRSWDEAIGKTCLELGYEPWHAQLHDREIEQVKATGQPVRGQVPFSGSFGRRIYDYIFVPVFGPDGRVEAVAGTTRDVTEMKASEERLREQDRHKDEFLAVLAHELRNPLAPIRTGLSLLHRPGPPEAQDKTLHMMERQLGHMVRLVDDLMDISRISTGKVQLRTERTDVRDAVETALESCRPLIEASGHGLQVSLSPEPLCVEADRTRLSQVIGNLINNAAKYTPEGGRIELAASSRDGQVVVSVSDNGAGIAPDMLPKVFDMFSQESRNLQRAQGGLGIGLALVKQLVEMHGGTVVAHSAGLGHGSTFTLALPAAATGVELAGPQEADAAAWSGAGSGAGSAAGLRILVVDDNVDAAESLASLLEIQGHSTRTAHSGERALEVLGGFAPDCALLDIGLPGMSGYELAQRLRAGPAGGECVLVALTGWGSEGDQRRSAQAGFDHHLTKPVEIGRLDRLLQDIRSRATAG